MDAEQKKKLELLKTKAKINERKQSLQHVMGSGTITRLNFKK